VADYGKILGLVEEVRDILGLDEASYKDHGLSHHMQHGTHKGVAISTAHHKSKDDYEPTTMSHGKKSKIGKKRATHAKAGGGGLKHNPFRRLKKGNLGPAVRKDPAHPGSPKKKWRCHCASYSCICKGLKGDVKGQKKVVHIDKAYKKSYNFHYRKWRKKHAKKYTGDRWKETKGDKMKAKMKAKKQAAKG